MPTDWLRVMLEEVARKQREAEAARTEAARRAPPATATAPPQASPPAADAG
ncbi:MAG: hypothetical protein JSR73_13520 [Proteobacteria bacterium]|nr:hypothetical protein [Pseudomonadota bacterium]